MKERMTKSQILTLPNLLSITRLLLIPLIVWLYTVKKDFVFAFAIIALSGITDVIDGHIARKYNLITDVGKVLDPIADKLTQCAVILCLLTRWRLMLILIVLFIIKEGTMLVFGIITLKKKDEINSARRYGKVCTAVLYVVTSILVVFPSIPIFAANILIFAAALIMLVALILYFRFYADILGM